MAILTTDEMDGIFTEEDKARKYNVYYQCRNCAKWTLIKGSAESYGNISKNGKCEHCDNSSFDTRSATSERTFNPFNKRKVK